MSDNTRTGVYVFDANGNTFHYPDATNWRVDEKGHLYVNVISSVVANHASGAWDSVTFAHALS